MKTNRYADAKFFSVSAAIALLVVARAHSSGVAVIDVYNSFGPGNTYDSGVVWAVSGASTSGGYRGQAEFFAPEISGYLAGIELATYHVSGSTLSNFYLAEDNGGGAPGAILESWMNVQNVDGLLTLNSTGSLLLDAGQQYWLCDEPAAANSYNGWYENSQNVANGFAFERSEWDWSAVGPPAPPSGVFSVSVTPVPEPSLPGLLTAGAAAFFSFRRPRCQNLGRLSPVGN